MRELILCKYGEIVLKGLNKGSFERQLRSRLERVIRPFGNFSVRSNQSVLFAEPTDDAADIDGAVEAARHVFGIAAVARAAIVEKSIEAMCAVAPDYLREMLRGKKTFKVESKRSDKRFPLTSPQISAKLGEAILTAMPSLRVDVNHPEVTVWAEVREQAAYLHGAELQGAGGLPIGSGGKGLLLLSGGIDSPVAGWMMAKRGMTLDALHFESFPYTSERARDKVLELARILAGWCGTVQVHVISLTEIQEKIRDHCDESYFTLLLRRFMMRLAVKMAQQCGAQALITGESLGQVASQTIDAFGITDSLADRVVFRPCIGLDKDEIVTYARRIGTFDTSILPYEDCCTVFTPRHPKTRPQLEKVLAQEALLNLAELEERAFSSRYRVTVRSDGWDAVEPKFS